MKVHIFMGFPCFMSTECYYSKMMVNSYRMKSLAVMKGGRTPSTKIITNKIGVYFNERLVTTPELWKPKKLP